MGSVNRRNGAIYRVYGPEKVSLYAKFLLERNLIPLIIEKARSKVLDIGSGDQPYRRFLGASVEQYIAVDYPKTSVSYNGTPNVWCDGEHLPFKDCYFDTVLCTEVLEHCMHPEKVISEASRSLKPGGFLILSLPLDYWMHDLPYDFHRFTPFGLRVLVEEQGFSVERMILRGSGFSVWIDLTVKLTFLVGGDAFAFLASIPFRVLGKFGVKAGSRDEFMRTAGKGTMRILSQILEICQRILIVLTLAVGWLVATLLPAGVVTKLEEKKEYWGQFYTLGLIALCQKKKNN